MRRVTLACAAGATLLAGCTAPSQPAPRPGGAPLSTSDIAYDQPQFLTNRPPVLQPGHECDKVNAATVAKLGLTPESGPEQRPHDLIYNGECDIQLNTAEIKIWSAPYPFAQYWMGAIPPGKPGGRVGAVDQASYFKRHILDNKYYAVEYATNADDPNGQCFAAVDTGSTNPLLVQVTKSLTGDVNAPVSLDKLKHNYCPAATETAKQLLRMFDPHGGSRAR